MELTLRSAIPSYSASTHRRLRTLAQRNLFVPSSQIKSSIFSSTRSRINPQLVSTKPPPSRAAAQMGDNGSSSTSTASQLVSVGGARCGEVKRVTKETDVFVRINLDGTGIADSSSGIPFLDHMLDQLASHGLFDVHVRATGDVHIDDHHTNEDVALAIGTALLQALGDRKGIHRFGDFSAPLDEALIHVALDLSGRPHLNYDLQIPTQRVGTYDTQLVEHFFQSLVNTSGMTLHIRQLAGKNSHHIIEATFKAFARALRQATEADPRRLGTVPRSVFL
ncbi:Imidazoleglycerol-phosphate dehydratase 2, chloroplastic [Linum grandiflorum]